jgi:hypothetical protein
MKAVKYQKKSLIKLEDLLKRRKTTLKKFLGERGITNYRMLEDTCSRLGVVTPSTEAFSACVPTYVTDPTAGVIVVDPLPVVSESTGEREELGDVFSALPPHTEYVEFSQEDSASEYEEPEIVAPIDEFAPTHGQTTKKKSKRAAGG